MALLYATIFLSTVTSSKEQLQDVARILSTLTPSSGVKFMTACKALDYTAANDLLHAAFKQLTGEDSETMAINCLASRLSDVFPEVEKRVTAAFTESDKILAIDEEFAAINDKLRLSELRQLSQLTVHELIEKCAGCLRNKASDWLIARFQKDFYLQCIALLYGLLKNIAYFDIACSIAYIIIGNYASELCNKFNIIKWKIYRPRELNSNEYIELCDGNNLEMNAFTLCISFIVLYIINEQRFNLTKNKTVKDILVKDILSTNTLVLLDLIHALAAVYKSTEAYLNGGE